MSEAAPRRASTRIEKLKQQREEQERIVAVAIQNELLQAASTAPAKNSEETEQSPPAEPVKKSKKIDEDEW